MPRLQTGDVLYVLFEELCAQARTIRLWDADRRDGWFAACAAVLAAVPDGIQRLAWAYQLAQALPPIGMPLCLVVAELLSRAQEVARCAW